MASKRGGEKAAAKAAGEAFFARRTRRRGKDKDLAPESLKGMNVVLFITDQERAIQHFPPGWAERHLPGLTRLQRTGVTFTNAFTNSCMCSPARATLMTGFFPAQHGVKYTLELDMNGPKYDQVELPVDYANLATVMGAAGYEAVYKGKWHLSKPVTGEWAPIDVHKYGFSRWNPPDAGANQDVPEAGGGWPDNDGRFMAADGAVVEGDEGVLAYLHHQARSQQPFFLVVSLVNPHDVLFYPNTYPEAGYVNEWLEGEIAPPATVGEDLSTKPAVQREFQALFNKGGGSISGEEMQRAYLNFYGNLMRASDSYLLRVLNALEDLHLRHNTVVIRTSDHGEMGLAHGGLRQKNFNFYEESTKVPLVFSNPHLWPGGRTSDALVSHVDFLPTVASLFGAPPEARAPWQGVDYSRLLLDPHAAPAQPYVVFTWDDWQAGQANGPYLPPPNHIVSYREARWKLARYYDANGKVPSQWEMYDLEDDPLEVRNIAWRGHRRTPDEERQLRRMKRRLAAIQRTRLAPRRVPA